MCLPTGTETAEPGGWFEGPSLRPVCPYGATLDRQNGTCQSKGLQSISQAQRCTQVPTTFQAMGAPRLMGALDDHLRRPAVGCFYNEGRTLQLQQPRGTPVWCHRLVITDDDNARI